MITVEELKQQFGVRVVAPYGDCVVIPEVKFQPSWEDDLKEQGYKVHYVVMDGKPTALIRLKTGPAEQGERLVYSPEFERARVSAEVIRAIQNPPSPSTPQPKFNPLGRRLWTAEEDQRLIELAKQNLNFEQIAQKMGAAGRNANAVKSRIGRLQHQGLFPFKNKRGPYKKREKPTPSVPLSTPSTLNIQSTPNTPTATVTRVTPPFEIKTTLTLNITVDCSDRNAIANFRAIVKELGGVTKKEVASAP